MYISITSSQNKQIMETITQREFENIVDATIGIAKSLNEETADFAVTYTRTITTVWCWGVLFRRSAFWIGIHFSEINRRYCINPIPFVTIWICEPGGTIPRKMP